MEVRASYTGAVRDDAAFSSLATGKATLAALTDFGVSIVLRNKGDAFPPLHGVSSAMLPLAAHDRWHTS